MTKTIPSTDCPIPPEYLEELEQRLGRSLAGWEEKRPRWVSPAPELEGAWFDVEAVVRVVNALRRMPHTKGRWARAAFEPETWQVVWLIGPVFGWKDADGFRIAREVFDEIPRKNGKSTLASRLALVLAAADGEMGAEVFAAATSTDQAKVVYNEAKVVAERSSALRRRCEPLANVIRFPRTGSVFRVLSKEGDAAHGLNVSGAVIDEIHLHKSRGLIDAIASGTGARTQPLIVYITTAGDDDETTIYAEKHNYAVKIGEGKVVDPTVWVCIWAADKEQDPFLEETWSAANPNFPISPTRAYLEKEFKKARETPTLLPTLLRLHLNIRNGIEGQAWSAAEAWELGAGMIPAEKLERRRAYGGIVAASATDLAAIAWTFENPEGEGVWTIWRHFLPEDRLPDLDRRTNGAAGVWAKQGLLSITPGDVIDLGAIVDQVKTDCRHFDVPEIAYVADNAIGVVQPLIEADVVDEFVVIHNNTPGSALVDWEALLRSSRYNHGGNPIIAWQVSHLLVRETAGGTWRIDRKGSPENVYGLVAGEISLRRYLVNQGDEGYATIHV